MAEYLNKYILIILTSVQLTFGLFCPEIPIRVSTIEILSDTSIWVVGPNYLNGKNASIISGTLYPGKHTGGSAIWETPTHNSNQLNVWIKFNKTFEVPQKTIIAAIIYYNIDDQCYFYLNNQYTNCFSTSYFNNQAKTCNVTAYVKNGTNDLKIDARDTLGGESFISFRLEIILSDALTSI
jgi:hypothetical protein